MTDVPARQNPKLPDPDQPLVSSQTLGWQGVRIEEYRQPARSQAMQADPDPVLVLTLATQPHRIHQVMGERRYSGLYRQGDISLTPAGLPGSYRAEGEDHYLFMQISTCFLQQVAAELQSDAIQLRPEFQVRDPDCEQLLRLLRTELHRGGSLGQLYADSLTNALAVNLLRRYGQTRVPSDRPALTPQGLSEPKLRQVIDYLHSALDQDIRLADLARLLNMSPFHFGRLFKQSTGLPPHQYLLHQRIERAKYLLKYTDQSLVDIALACGFNSHSHLSKQFRQLTGMTPKAYRSE